MAAPKVRILFTHLGWPPQIVVKSKGMFSPKYPKHLGPRNYSNLVRHMQT